MERYRRGLQGGYTVKKKKVNEFTTFKSEKDINIPTDRWYIIVTCKTG